GVRRRWVLAGAGLAVVLAATVGVVAWPDGGGDGPPRVPEPFAGTWRGQVSESDGYRARPVSVTLALPEGQDSGTLTGSRCAGSLLLDALDGDRMTLRITTGPCANGTVLATLGGGGLDFELRGGGSATGHGVLRR
ncbi:MAG TPA: hypothetical protein VHJ17_14830, partial [Thermomonospora sp.]|nr:hypothetical protein [Thermomonospora sp.]